MAFSSITYTGDGTTTSFSVPFPYLFQGDIAVTVNGTAVAFTFTNPALITTSVAPVAGAAVFIKRTTDITTLVVEFVDGSTVQASDINTDATQGLYLAQEAADGVSVAVTAAATATAAAGNANTAAAAANAAVATLVPFTGDSGSGGVRGLVPAPPAGSFAAGKFLSAGGSWASPPAAAVTVLDSTIATAVGFVGDGVTTNDAALAAYFTSLAGKSGCLSFPAGNFVFASAASYTMTAGQSITLRGVATLATQLTWTAASGGLTLTAATAKNTFHIRDMTFVTTQVSGGTGLHLVGVGANNGQQFQSDLINVDFQGSDIGPSLSTQYWAMAILIHNWGSINGFNVNTWGNHPSPFGAGGGVGLRIEGDTPTSSFTSIINFSQSSFNYHGTGVVLGAFWQGITFNQCNFNGVSGTAAIQQIGGSTSTLALLSVLNCQINYAGAAGTAQIILASPVATATFIGNTITLAGNSSIGIDALAGCTGLIVHGNIFNLFGATTGNIGVSYSGAGGSIMGNWFHALALGVTLQTGSTQTNVSQNSYTGVTTQVTDSGTGNFVGVVTK